MTERKAMVDKSHKLPINRQCQLLELSRSSFYYRGREVSESELQQMRQIDEIHTQRPFYGSRRIRDWFEDQGISVNHKRIQRLMRLMGIQALYPKKKTSRPGKGHKVYPYLLTGLDINGSNQVWAADITYIPHGQRVSLSGGHHGLAQPKSTLLAAIKHDGRLLLLRSVKRKRFSATVNRKSLTPTRGHNSPRWILPIFSNNMTLPSAWMVKVVGWTISLSNACGAA